jgi:hypothetical protein
MPRDGMSQRPGTRRIDERCCWPRWVVAPVGEPSQQLRVQLATSAGAVTLNVDIDTGLSGPLERSKALLEYEPFVGGVEPSDARSHLTNGRDVDFPTDGGVQDAGAVAR